jgi:hypothetical protein
MLVLAVRRPLPACISIRTALCYVGARCPSSSTGMHQHTHGSMLCRCSPSVVLYQRASAYARLIVLGLMHPMQRTAAPRIPAGMCPVSEPPARPCTLIEVVALVLSKDALPFFHHRTGPSISYYGASFVTHPATPTVNEHEAAACWEREREKKLSLPNSRTVLVILIN